MSEFQPTERTQIKRLPKRGHYDRETVYQILDTAFVCHVGFAVDGQPSSFPRITAVPATPYIFTAVPPVAC